MSRDFHYRESVARLHDAETKEWIAELPVGDMVRFGWIRPVEASQRGRSVPPLFRCARHSAWRRKYAYSSKM